MTHFSISTIFPSAIALVAGLMLLWLIVHLKAVAPGFARLLIWVCWTSLLFAATAFLTTRVESLETRFQMLSAASFIMGILYLVLAPLTLDWWRRDVLADVFLLNAALLCFGIFGCLIIYHATTPVAEIYPVLQGVVAFGWPSLALKAYDWWVIIPSKKYKSWTYPVHEPVPRLLPVDTIKVRMNFTPVPGPLNGFFEGYDVEFPVNVSLGDLFHYFISFHNKHREYRKNPIQFMTEDHRPLEWVIFKYTSGKKKVYLNTDQTLAENQIGQSETIYAASLTK